MPYLVKLSYLNPIRRQLDNSAEISSQVRAADWQEGSNGQDLVGYIPDVQLLPGIQRCLGCRLGRVSIFFQNFMP